MALVKGDHKKPRKSNGVPRSKRKLSKHKLAAALRSSLSETSVEDGILSPEEDKFCKLYATDAEFFCNGLQTYIEVFGYQYTMRDAIDWHSMRQNVSKMLKNLAILKRIDKYLEFGGLNDAFVDKQLYKIIQQDADLKAKLGAIAEYNKLKARIKNLAPVDDEGNPITQAPTVLVMDYKEAEALIQDPEANKKLLGLAPKQPAKDV